MNKQSVIRYFGSINKTAKALGIAHTSVMGWDEEVIPEAMASRIDRISNGELYYDHVFYMEYKISKKQQAA